jgi:predicted kinase
MSRKLTVGEELHADTLARHILGRSKKRLVVLCGVPASGKTTLCDALEKRGAERVNRDLIRKRLYGDEGIIGIDKDVNAEYYRELGEALALGRPVVSDNVNVIKSHRRLTIKAAVDAGFKHITIVKLDVPLETCLDRNRKRERVVKEDVIRDLHRVMTKEGMPPEPEAKVVIIGNGKDRDHYVVTAIRQPISANTTTTNV